jgi:hypothetical protein
MKPYSQVTPIVTLLDGTTDIDTLRSPYTNIRWGVTVDTVMTVDSKYEANLPGLAFDYYGDVQYWRAILAFNGLVDPINDVQVGVILGLPNKSSLEAFMTSNQSSVQQPTLVL